jgi:tetratricopeptide repeat protein/PEGA domain-containing protein
VAHSLSSSHQRRWFSWAVALLVSSTGVCALAQDMPAENPDADRFVARGIALRAEGKDSEALQAFQQAEAIDPSSVRVQIHLATVYQALGNWLLADEYLSKALARQNHPYINRHRQVLEDAKRVIDSNIGRLEVDGEPPGAEVSLSGRALGTLPLAEPVRSTVGSYVLEVRSPGYYPLRRPISIVGGGLVRESVHLQPMPVDEPGRPVASDVAGGASVGGMEEAPPSRVWLTWTFAGAAIVAGTTAAGAVIFREVHAERWNDDTRCLDTVKTRAEMCGDERDKVETAETVAWVSGGLAGLFLVGAAVNAFAFQPEAGSPPASAGLELQGCGVGLAGASCFGRF